MVMEKMGLGGDKQCYGGKVALNRSSKNSKQICRFIPYLRASRLYQHMLCSFCGAS